MPELKGFMVPRTPEGRASIVPRPPWHYSRRRADDRVPHRPGAVAELLPDGVEPADEDPGAVAIIWADWQIVQRRGDELLDPVRSQYKEMFVVVRCTVDGRALLAGASTSGSTRTSRWPAAGTRATRRSSARSG